MPLISVVKKETKRRINVEDNKGPAGGSEKHKVNEPAAVNKELALKVF